MENLTLENKTNEVQTIRLYEVNIPITLQPGSFIKLTPTNNVQEIYYKTIQEQILDANGDEPTPPTPPTPGQDYNKTFLFQDKGQIQIFASKETMEAGVGNISITFENYNGSNVKLHFSDYYDNPILLYPDKQFTQNIYLTEISVQTLDDLGISLLNEAVVEETYVYYKTFNIADPDTGNYVLEFSQYVTEWGDQDQGQATAIGYDYKNTSTIDNKKAVLFTPFKTESPYKKHFVVYDESGTIYNYLSIYSAQELDEFAQSNIIDMTEVEDDLSCVITRVITYNDTNIGSINLYVNHNNLKGPDYNEKNGTISRTEYYCTSDIYKYLVFDNEHYYNAIVDDMSNYTIYDCRIIYGDQNLTIEAVEQKADEIINEIVNNWVLGTCICSYARSYNCRYNGEYAGMFTLAVDPDTYNEGYGYVKLPVVQKPNTNCYINIDAELELQPGVLQYNEDFRYLDTVNNETLDALFDELVRHTLIEQDYRYRYNVNLQYESNVIGSVSIYGPQETMKTGSGECNLAIQLYDANYQIEYKGNIISQETETLYEEDINLDPATTQSLQDYADAQVSLITITPINSDVEE